MSGLLSGENLTLFRGDRCLFSKLAFALEPGEVLLVEGPNGSGKTSLLRAVAGLADLETGTLAWKGRKIADDRQAYHADLAFMSHKIGLKSDLNLLQNLRFEAGLRSTDWSGIDRILERLSLHKLTGLPLRALSAGQQRRVTLARMLLANATLWLMDEPLTNLDAAGGRLVTEIVAEHLADRGLAVIASHQPLALDAPIRRVSLQ